MRAVLAPVCLVGGALTGLGAVLAHADGRAGLALAVAATLAVAAALPGRWWGRLCYAAGWVVVVGLGAWPRPEGDYLVAADLPGYTLLGTGLVLLVGTLLTLPHGRPGRADQEDRPPAS